MASEKLINEGRALIDQLKKDGIKLSYAVWYTDPAEGTTYLSLGANSFDTDGPKASYHKINEALKQLQQSLSLLKGDAIRLVPLYSGLGKTFSQNFDGDSGDASIGMFVSGEFVLHQVYAYKV